MQKHAALMNLHAAMTKQYLYQCLETHPSVYPSTLYDFCPGYAMKMRTALAMAKSRAISTATNLNTRWPKLSAMFPQYQRTR